jgi:hypothetical protein
MDAKAMILSIQPPSDSISPPEDDPVESRCVFSRSRGANSFGRCLEMGDGIKKGIALAGRYN